MSHPLWSFFNSAPCQTNHDLAVFSKAPRPWSYRGLSNLKKSQALFLQHPGSCSARLWARCVHSSHSVHLCRSSIYHSSRKSLRRLYQYLLNEQANKWTNAPILEMEETRPREIQFKPTHSVCVCVCVSILMSPLWTRMTNDVSEGGGEGPDIFWRAETSAMKDTEPCPS